MCRFHRVQFYLRFDVVNMRLIVGLVLLVLAYCEKVSYEGYKGLSVVTPTETDVAYINGFGQFGVKIILEPSTKRPCVLAVPPLMYDMVLNMLRNSELEYEKIYDNLQKEIDEQKKSSDVNRNIAQYRSGGNMHDSVASYFPTYKQAMDWLYSAAQQFPSLASIEYIGKSHEGNDQVAIKIGTPGVNKPVIWIDGGIHAREWATVPTTMYIASRLLGDSDNATRTLLQKYDFYLMPIFNPDGYIHTHDVDRMWRKNRRYHGSDRWSWRQCSGVDLNRNFGHHWGESGASFEECNDSYLGAEPFSEPETRNVRDALLRFKGRLQMYMNLHAYGQLWMIPYAYDHRAHFPHEDQHRRVATAAARAIYYSDPYRRTSYRVGKPGEMLYNAAGGTFDWVYAEAGAKYAFAAELSPSFAQARGLRGFDVSPNEMPYIAKEVYTGIRAAIDAM